MVEPKTMAMQRNGAALDSCYAVLRKLGARAHQLRATTRAADRFILADATADRDTGSWLVSCSVGLAADVTAEVDELARTLKESAGEAALSLQLVALRKRAHELHAACRAADRFLDEETREDQETGHWLVVCARSLADRLASEIDDNAGLVKRTAVDGLTAGSVETIEAVTPRRVATAPLRA